ncbi:MAG TPA: glycosyltransferase family 9 protein [Chlorobiota bacterium]|nr:glycosyltransferase family 9 protein [Chlorobiota bacterium]
MAAPAVAFMTYIYVQTAFLGDVILGLPALAALKQSNPSHSVVLVTTPMAADFVRGLPYVDDVIVFDKRRQHASAAAMKTLAAIVRQRFTNIHAIVPHASYRTMRLVRAMRPTKVTTFTTTWTRWIATNVIPYPGVLHDTERQRQLVQAAVGEAIPSVTDVLPLNFGSTSPGELIFKEFSGRTLPENPPGELVARELSGRTLPENPPGELVARELSGRTLPENPPGDYVVLAPGAVWATKRWPTDRFSGLADALIDLGVNVVIIGDVSVQGLVTGRKGLFDIAGRTTLREAASVIAGARATVANDSAPLHISALQGVPTVGIFGPTVKEFGFGPIGRRARIVEVSDLACRPCSDHGSTVCPMGHFQCMMDISITNVVSALRDIEVLDVKGTES